MVCLAVVLRTMFLSSASILLEAAAEIVMIDGKSCLVLLESRYASAAGKVGGCYDDWALDGLVARKVSDFSDA